MGGFSSPVDPSQREVRVREEWRTEVRSSWPFASLHLQPSVNLDFPRRNMSWQMLSKPMVSFLFYLLTDRMIE